MREFFTMLISIVWAMRISGDRIGAVRSLSLQIQCVIETAVWH